MASKPPPQSRVFIDSSVLISASISRTGYARDLLFMGLDAQVELVASTFVVGETQRNLAKKSPGVLPFLEWLLDTGIFRIVDPPAPLVQEIALLVEPKDAAIVAGAKTAQCPSIATFDRRHLLAEAVLIQEHWGIRVEEPGATIQRLAQHVDNG